MGCGRNSLPSDGAAQRVSLVARVEYPADMTVRSPKLNHGAAALCESIFRRREELQIACSTVACGTKLFDFGIAAAGSLEAGVKLARVCLADLATVRLDEVKPTLGTTTLVSVAIEQPVAACMASQYAGWEVKGEKYFAMGSGPMRAAAGREPLFDEIGFREEPDVCVGVLEAAQLPTVDVCRIIAERCGVKPQDLTLLVAPTSSIAGTVQVVARSVETAMHKLHELGFDLLRVVERRRNCSPAPGRCRRSRCDRSHQ